MPAGVGISSLVCHSQDALSGSQEGNKKHWGTLGIAEQEGTGERMSLEYGESRAEESEAGAGRSVFSGWLRPTTCHPADTAPRPAHAHSLARADCDLFRSFGSRLWNTPMFKNYTNRIPSKDNPSFELLTS